MNRRRRHGLDDGVPGLDYPNEAYRLANGNTLITDRNNNRVIEVTPQRDDRLELLESRRPAQRQPAAERQHAHLRLGRQPGGRGRLRGHGRLAVCHRPELAAVAPSGSANGNTLIADTGHNRVIEVDASGAIVWSATGLVTAVHRRCGWTTATRWSLAGSSGRVVELTSADGVVWQYPNTVAVVVETLQVVNPSSGCSLYVHIHRPAYAGPDNPRARGGLRAGRRPGTAVQLDTTGLPDDIASDGFAFLHFDPDGRGRSSAYPENYDGYVHQDGLHACLSLLAGRDVRGHEPAGHLQPSGTASRWGRA